jgi:hypothetical protein
MNLYSRWRFTVLLVVLGLLFAGRVISSVLPHSRLLVDLGAGAVTLAAAASLSGKGRRQLAGVLAGTIVVVLTFAARDWFDQPHIGLLVAMRVCATLFLGWTIAAILRTLLTQSEVTHDSLAGVVCGYLLLGLVWTEMYCWVALESPDAFGGAYRTEMADNLDHRWQLLEYFSFATLTTVGFGDIVPISPIARMLACLEAICGQFYLAVVVAGLVGVHFSGRPTVRTPTAPHRD